MITIPPFRPHPLVRSGHAQTVFAAYAPGKVNPYRAKEIHVSLEDGDSIVLHDDCPGQWQTGDRVALLLHGLGGSHLSGYMVRVAQKLNANGVRVFRMDLRGCGAGFALARIPTHAGRSEDAAAAVAHIMELCPDSPVALVGFSMGANIVLKMMGELGDMAPPLIDRVAAVAPPIDLTLVAGRLQQGTGILYDKMLLRYVLPLVEKRRRIIVNPLDEPMRPPPRRLYDFDARHTAPLGGFSSPEHYYEQASAGAVLRNISAPTLILTAEDDPIIPVAMFHNATCSESTQLVITERGGHVGYLGVKGIDPDRRWMDWRILDWIFAPVPKKRNIVQPVHT